MADLKFKIKKSTKNDQYYWVLVGGNGEPLCTSETYTTKESAKHTIGVVQSGAAKAGIVDETK